MAEEPPERNPDGRRLALVCLAFVALAAVLYAPSLGGDFLNWDDPGYILNNPEIHLPWNRAAESIFSSFLFSNYNPLQRLSYWFEWRLSGGDALLFRLVSLGCHVANATLLYLVLLRFVRTPNAALLGAVLFLVLPANVEDVAWISERKTLLACGFALGSVLCWQRGRPWLALTVFSFGLLAKTSIVVLPMLLLLLDWQERRTLRWRWYAGFCLPATVIGLVQIAATHHAILPPHGGSLWTHVGTILGVLPAYARDAILPFGHLPRQLFTPVLSLGDPRLWSGFVLLAAIVYGMWRSSRAERRFCVAAAFGLAALYLTLIVPIPIILADRYLYLALPLLLGVFADALLRLPNPIAPRPTVAQPALLVGVALVCVYSWGTFHYAAQWHDSRTLWSYTVEHSPDDREAWVSLAAAQSSAGEVDKAVQTYLALLERFPDFAEATENLALLELGRGNPRTAAARLSALVAEHPERGSAWGPLAVAYDLQGDADRARKTFATGLSHCPDHLPLVHNCALFYLRRGDRRRALATVGHFLRRNPGHAAGERLVMELTMARPGR